MGASDVYQSFFIFRTDILNERNNITVTIQRQTQIVQGPVVGADSRVAHCECRARRPQVLPTGCYSPILSIHGFIKDSPFLATARVTPTYDAPLLRIIPGGRRLDHDQFQLRLMLIAHIHLDVKRDLQQAARRVYVRLLRIQSDG